MNHALHDAIEAELLGAFEASGRGAYDRAFRHLERVHILGQRFTILHVRVHWRRQPRQLMSVSKMPLQARELF